MVLMGYMTSSEALSLGSADTHCKLAARLGCGDGEKKILSDFGSQNYFGAGR